ncbi:MAG TPA: serine/threonine-protein kinase [Solirubrobacteraceae bacterium]|nr:serine/threonine-protein kinase [Solirubrobacteraceae bacterium]
MSELPPGTVFAGHRIEAVIGRGGMGVVYRATQLDLERPVALKIVAPELVQDETARRRFVQESRLAASIDHPHVIPIHQAGEEGGVPYLVMRYVAGDDGRSLVRREGALPPERASRIVAQVADALDAAHMAGLVHRDVKPANVLLGAGDHAYLSDFGLTRHVRSISDATRTGHWVGTLDYVAPEQIRGGDIDARADVYALGCLLFFLLTAQVPFPSENDEAKLWAHLTAQPPRVTAVVPEAPAAFDDVIRRALAKAPDQRYPSAGDLGRAAVAAAAGVRSAAPERAVARAGAAPVETRTRTSVGPGSPRGRTRLIGRVALLAAGVIAGVVALVLAVGDERERDGSPARARPPEPRVVSRLRTAPRPSVLATFGPRLWVGTFGADRLQAVDVKTNSTLSRFRPPVGKGTEGLAVGGDVLWVAARPQRLLRLDPTSGRPVAPPIDLPMRPIELVADGDDVWVSLVSPAGASAQIARLDAATGTIQAIIPVSTEIRGMLFARGWLWTLHADPNVLLRRDPRTLVPRQRVDLPGRTVGSLAYGAGSVWATIPDEDQLVRYNERSRTRATVAVGSRPIGVAVRDRQVLVAASGSSTLEFVDARSLRPARDPLRVPLNPQALLVRQDTIWLACVGVNVVARVEPAA